MIIVLFVHGVNNEQVCVDYCYFPFRLQRKRVSATLNGHDEQRVVSQEAGPATRTACLVRFRHA
jgi:hypothetical protein